MTLTNTVPTIAIYQEFTHSPTELTDALKALIVGPHYELRRFATADEKELAALGDYDSGSGGVYDWPNKTAGAVVDEDYTKVYIEDALLRYFYNPTGDAHIIQAVAANKIRAADIVWRTTDAADRDADLEERDVAVGDVIKIEGTDIEEGTGDPITHTTTVAGFEYEEVAAVVPATADEGDGIHEDNSVGTVVAAHPSITNTITASAAAFDALPYGLTSETYTITCTQSMSPGSLETARFKATSASGLDDVADFTFEDGFGNPQAIGAFGGTATITAGADIEVGDNVTITYNADYTKPTVTTVEDGYTGADDVTYVIRVLAVDEDNTTNTFSVTTTDGSDSSGPSVVTVGDELTVGSYGITVSLDELACPGDVWYLDVTAATDGACQTIVLKNSMPAALATAVNATSLPGDIVPEDEAIDLAVTLYIKKTVELDAEYYTQDTDEITIDGGAQAYDSSWTIGGNESLLPIESGSLYVEYRALLQTFVDGRSSLSDSSDVESTLGPICGDNPLALGVYLALLNSHGVEVGFIGVESDDLAGYNAALDAVKDDFRCYSIAPLTQDVTVHDAVKSHVLAQSEPERSRFRIAWLNSASPRSVVISDETSDGSVLKATIAEDGNTGNYVILSAEDAQFVTDGVQAGDTVRINFTVEGDYDEYEIEDVAEDILTLVSGPDTEVSVATKIEVWHAQTKAEMAAAYAAKSQHFADRRVRHIWPGTVELSDGTAVDGYFACAALAGMKSAAAPHQPLSNTQVDGLGGAALSLYVGEANLDTIARGGTWVLTQERADMPVYTRLSISTDVSDANHWQDARTTNVDSLSLAYRNRLKQIAGTANISQRLLSFIANEIRAVSEYYMVESSTPLLGPQLLSVPEFVRGPEQNAVLQDTVDVELSLEIPYANDRTNVKLVV